MSSNSIIFLAGVLIYMAILIIAGWLYARGKSDGESFLSAGGHASILLVFGSLVASCIGAGTSIGSTGTAYFHGWAGGILSIAVSLGFLMLLFYTRYRKYNLKSFPEEVQFMYGGNAYMKYVVAFMTVFIECLWLGSNINGGSKFLSYATGLNDVVCKLIITVALVAFSFFGGYLSVLFTDTIQSIVIFAGFLIISIKVLTVINGPAGIIEAYTDIGNTAAFSILGYKSYGMKAALALLVANFFGAFAFPAVHQRILTSKSEKAARKSFLTSAFFMIIISFLPSILGMSAFALAHGNGVEIENSDYVFSYLAMESLGTVLGSFFLISAISAVISSADTNLMSAETAIFNDVLPIFGKKKGGADLKKSARIGIVVIVIVSFCFALYATDVISYFSSVVGAMLPGISAAILMGRFWKRVTWQGGMTSMLSGLVIGVIYLVAKPFNVWLGATFGGPAIPIFVITLVLGILVSLCTPSNAKTEDEVMELVIATRGFSENKEQEEA